MEKERRSNYSIGSRLVDNPMVQRCSFRDEQNMKETEGTITWFEEWPSFLLPIFQKDSLCNKSNYRFINNKKDAASEMNKM